MQRVVTGEARCERALEWRPSDDERAVDVVQCGRATSGWKVDEQCALSDWRALLACVCASASVEQWATRGETDVMGCRTAETEAKAKPPQPNTTRAAHLKAAATCSISPGCCCCILLVCSRLSKPAAVRRSSRRETREDEGLPLAVGDRAAVPLGRDSAPAVHALAARKASMRGAHLQAGTFNHTSCPSTHPPAHDSTTRPFPCCSPASSSASVLALLALPRPDSLVPSPHPLPPRAVPSPVHAPLRPPPPLHPARPQPA